MKRFFFDLRKYKNYIFYSTKAQLKSEITGSYLGWIWLILNPLCSMLIYAFIVKIVFKSNVENFPVFVFIGLLVWDFFNRNVIQSVKLVSYNRDKITKVYLPKFVLLLVQMGVNFFKLMISFVLIIIFMIIYKIPISFNIVFLIPVLIVLIVLTFGVSSIFMHFGVFVSDLSNITSIIFKFVLYLSGIFYDIGSKVPKPFNKILLYGNPIAYLMNDARNTLMYCSSPNFLVMFVWLVVAVILSSVGVHLIYKYENTYVKVMR